MEPVHDIGFDHLGKLRFISSRVQTQAEATQHFFKDFRKLVKGNRLLALLFPEIGQHCPTNILENASIQPGSLLPEDLWSRTLPMLARLDSSQRTTRQLGFN